MVDRLQRLPVAINRTRYTGKRATRTLPDRRRLLSVESLEERTLLTIVWDQELGFDVLGEDEPIARQLVERAVSDWNRIIRDFDFDGDGNASTDNTFTVNIGIFQFGFGTRGASFITEFEDGKGRAGDIFIDNNGGLGLEEPQNWYFDPTPLDDAEFIQGFSSLFSATTPGDQPDFYRTVVHEIGHTVGIIPSPKLSFADFRTPAGTDQVDNISSLEVFHNPNGTYGQDGFRATFTSKGRYSRL